MDIEKIATNTSFKNHSMLEETKLNNKERMLKRFNTKWLEKCYAPVGHVYSVIVEELNIKNPDLQGFIETINQDLTSNGNSFACIKNPLETFYSRTIRPLSRFLGEKIRDGEITEKSCDLIMKEACGGVLPY